MTERWKDIQGYEWLYQVSSFGRIKSLAKEILIKNGYTRHQEERFPALHPNTHGYLTIGLYKNAKRKHRTVHRHYRVWETDRKSTRLNSSHSAKSRMPSSA